jgi:hypothetical protein
VTTQELGRHEIVLRFQDKAIGVAAPVEGVPLQLQTLDYSPGQRWTFDGDTLMSAADPTLVAAVMNGRTPRGTPVVLKRRDLAVSEFWRFVALDGSNMKPHGGFVRVPADPGLQRQTPEEQLQNAVNAAQWGTVIEIDQNAALEMDAYPLVVPAGVTIRGDRRGTNLGPELKFRSFPERNGLIDIAGDHVRVTGLRLQGPSTTKDEYPGTGGIAIHDADFESALIDHNEMWGWTHAAVRVISVHPYDETPCDDIVPDRPRNVQVVRNFIHHNIRGGLGYGVTMYPNGFATIAGNTFVYNRHAIAADGHGLSGYRALYNLVTSAAPGYGVLGGHEHDFDMHGTEWGSAHNGGHAGNDVEIVRNTFLGTNRYNYVLRGIPCGLHRFNSNIVRRSAGGAVEWFEYTPSPPGFMWLSPPSRRPVWLQVSSNRFDSADPTDHLGVGDFDGDGVDDLFLATGTAWYYASGGQAEWRLRGTRPETMGSLVFGDVDGDGRTDVLIRQGTDWLVSWAGASKAEKINERDGNIGDFAVHDFNGDGRADMLYTDGSSWFISYGCTSPFGVYEPGQSARVQNLRFGDFNRDAKTDVLVVTGGYWMVRYGGKPGLSILRPALSASASGLVVADFNGDGRADVATSQPVGGLWIWAAAYNGTEEWSPLRSATFRLSDAAAIGSFDGTAGADVLDWNLIESGPTKYLDVASSAGPDAHRHSRDHMR